jgi:nitroreductase
MDSNPVIDAIKTRRNVRRFRDQPISREVVSQVLDSAIWAPNHYLTEPWRFVIIAGDERKRLGQVMAQALQKISAAAPPPPEKLDRERTRPLEPPVIVALISSPKDRVGAKLVVPQEEIVTAGAALQNMVLAAHSMGLGTKLETGMPAYSADVREFLHLKDTESLVCFVYLGVPEGEPIQGRRAGLEGKVSWRGM